MGTELRYSGDRQTMADIVEQLRDRAYCGKAVDRLLEQAADLIEQLRAQVQADERKSNA